MFDILTSSTWRVTKYFNLQYYFEERQLELKLELELELKHKIDQLTESKL